MSAKVQHLELLHVTYVHKEWATARLSAVAHSFI